MLKNKKLVCFDLDGTLIDSVGIWNQVDAELIFQLSGQKVDLNHIQMLRDQQLIKHKNQKDPYLEYCDFLSQKYDFNLAKTEVKTRRYSISQYFLDHVVTLKPNAERCIQYLQQQGLQLALTTTTSLMNIERYTKNNAQIHTQLNFAEVFSLILTRENVQNIKPDPEIYLKALAHFNISAEQCLIIEDSLIGINAAKSARIDVWAIYDLWSHTEWTDIQSQANLSFQSYAEMLTKLDQ